MIMMKHIRYIIFAAMSMMICACSRDEEPEVLGSLFLGDGGEAKVLSYEAVDLGLSVKWADCNLGGLKSWQKCMFFAWGEISEKKTYTWDNYLYYSPDNPSLLKYNLADGLRILGSKDDPVTALMGSKWRMPTGDELVELLENCDWTISTRGSDKIITATSRKNGASIEFPLTGYKEGDSLKDAGVHGYIWSSELVKDTPSQAYIIDFNTRDNKVSIDVGDRALGLCVRGVR